MSDPTNTVSHEYKAPPVVKRKEKAGCFFYSCLTVICIMVVFTGALYWGATTILDNLAGEYGDLEPKSFEPLEISQAEKLEIQKKINSFSDKSSSDANKQIIRLSEKDLNFLLSEGSGEWLPEQSVIRVKIDDSLTASFSISLKDSPLGLDYFINGESDFNFSIQNCKLVIQLLSAKIKDKQVDPSALATLNQTVGDANFEQDEQIKELFDQVKTIEIKNGELVIESGSCE